MRPPITVGVFVEAPIEKIWPYWIKPKHIEKWYRASEDWCVPKAENDLRVGGGFKTRMEAKDGSAGFDFEGTYTALEEGKWIEYALGDGRKVRVEFVSGEGGCRVIETFDPEEENSLEMQKNGWQAILESFKRYVEA